MRRLVSFCTWSCLVAAPVACIRSSDTVALGNGGIAVAAEPNELPADGVSAARIAVVLRDVAGNPLAGRQATLRCDDANARLTQPGPTDAQGISAGALTARVPGTYVVHATFLDAGGRVAAPVAAQVQFVAPSPDATVDPSQGPPSLRLAVSGNAAVADGNGVLMASVRVARADGAPFVGATVQLAGEDARDAVTPAAGTTDVNGSFSASLRSTLSGVRTLLASVGDARAEAAYAFVAGPPDLGRSFLRLLDDGVGGEGQGAVSVQVVLRDAFDNPVVGEPVNLRSSSPNVVFVPPSGTSDGNGTLAVTVRSPAVGVVPVVASLPSRAPVAGATPGQPNASFGPQVQGNATFVVGPPNASRSSLTVSPDTLTADNNGTGTVALVLRDAQGNPVPNQAVSLASSNVGGNDTFSPSTGPTNAAGVFTASWRSSKAETKALTASAGQVTKVATATFLAGPASATRSTLVAAFASVPATGFYPNTLAFTARDAFGNPLPHRTFALRTAGTSLRLPIDPTLATDANALATAKVSSTVTQNASAFVPLADGNVAASLAFTVPTPVSQAQSSFLVSAANALVADGKTPVTATLVAKDDNGNPLPYVGVSLRSSTNNLEMTPFLGATDANGRFVAKVTSRVSGAATLWAASGNARLSQALAYLPRAKTCTRFLTMDGTSPATRLSDIPEAIAMVSADVDQDGHADVAFTTPTTVGVAWGRGDGTLGIQYGLSRTGFAANQLSVSDLDGDGKLDLLYVGTDGDAMGYVLANGDRTFSGGQVLSLEPSPSSVLARDFDHDGLVDLAVASRDDGQVHIWRATSALDWTQVQSLAVGAEPNVLLAADLDGDGATDLLVLDRGANANNLFVLPGTAGGNFLPAVAYGAGPSPAYDAVVADVNADGYPDVVVTSSAGTNLATLLNRGDGTLAPALLTASSLGASGRVHVADVDNNGAVDLVLSVPGAAGVLRGNNTGRFVAGSPLGFRRTYADSQLPTSVAVTIDLNEDGNVDYVAAANENTSLLIAQGRGDGTFFAGAANAYAAGPNPSHVVAADVDADGVLDLVVANADRGQIVVLRGLGDGSFVAAHTLTTAQGAGVFSVTATDLNLDGLVDLVAADAATGGANANQLEVFLGVGGGNFASPSTYTLPSQPHICAAADLNADGFADLACTSGDVGAVYVIFGDGTGRLTAAPGSVDAQRCADLAFADVDNDGYVDLLVAAQDDGVYVLKNDNSANFTLVNNLDPYAVDNYNAVLARDFTSDGIVDAFTVDAFGSLFAGSGNFAFNYRDGSNLSTWNFPPVGADFDGDGRLDLVLGTQVTLGGGDGTFGGPLLYPFPQQPLANAVGDFNGDGLVDFVTIDGASGAALVFLNGGCGAPTASGTPAPATTVVTLSPNVAVTNDAIAASVQVRDGNGVPVAHAGVVWTADGGNNVFVPASGLTDANGIATTSLRSARAQAQNVQAVVAGTYVVAAAATTVAGTPNATLSLAPDRRRFAAGAPVAAPAGVPVTGPSTKWTPVSLGGLCLDVGGHGSGPVLAACNDAGTPPWSPLPDTSFLVEAANRCVASTTLAPGGTACATPCSGNAP